MKRPTLRRCAVLLAGGLAAAAVAGCNSSSTSAASTPTISTPRASTSTAISPPSSAPTTQSTATGPGNGVLAPPSSLGTDPSIPDSTPSLSAEEVADPGLPSHLGTGKLSKPQVVKLLQYLENHVSKAYAKGDAADLDHYLAGPMLSGNAGTINLLNSKHRRNVFKIQVQSVQIQADESHQIELSMAGDMKVDYFFNSRTHKLIDQGLPGPSRVQFLIILSQNPKTHTWYWTGEQSNANAGDTEEGSDG